jgi:hypothetical protein
VHVLGKKSITITCFLLKFKAGRREEKKSFKMVKKKKKKRKPSDVLCSWHGEAGDWLTRSCVSYMID